jgi:hypothetical protein
MNAFDKNWLTTPPYDYELKYYKLMDGIKKIKFLISENKLYTAQTQVEKQLQHLYDIKYAKDEIERNSGSIIGINIDTMSIQYEYPENADMSDIYEICDFAIDILEKVYSIIREKWRIVESHCTISEIPDKKVLNKKGYVMYIEPNADLILVYSYKNPSNSNETWNSFKLTYVKSMDNTLRDIASFIAESETKSDEYRFFRFDVKIKDTTPSFEECMLPLMGYCIFKKIKPGI